MSNSASKAAHMGEDGWCTVIITATRSLAATSRRAPSTVIARDESSPVNGSSINSNRGRESSSVAILSLLSSPPDRPRSVIVPTTVCRALSSRRSLTIRCISSVFSCTDQLAGRRSIAVQRRWSCTVNLAKKMSFCIEYAAERFQLGGSGRPLMSTVPSQEPLVPSAGRAASRLRRVVLPAPDGPMTASSSPGRASPHASKTTCLGALAASSKTNALTCCHVRCMGTSLPPNNLPRSSSSGEVSRDASKGAVPLTVPFIIRSKEAQSLVLMRSTLSIPAPTL